MQQTAGTGLDPLWVDLAQVVGAIATASGVLITLAVAMNAYLRQRRVDVRDQASKVSVHRESRSPGTAFQVWDEAIVINSSGSPVYDVTVGVGYLQPGGAAFLAGNEHNSIVAVVPPGTFESGDIKRLKPVERTPDGEGGFETKIKADPHGKRGVTVTFTDSAGRHWERNARGRLTQIKKSPAEARELTEPLPWGDVRSPRQ